MMMMTMIVYGAFVFYLHTVCSDNIYGSAKVFPAFRLLAIPSALLAISMSNLCGCISYVIVY